MKPRENPFSTAEILKVSYLLPEDQWVAVLQKLKQLSYRGAVVGRHGIGKTTFLEELNRRLLRLGVTTRYFSSESGPLSWYQICRSFIDQQVIIIDGFAMVPILLAYPLRLLAICLGRGLIVSQHEEFLLPTFFTPLNSTQTLQQVLTQFSLPPEICPAEISEYAEQLFIQEDGNIRTVLLKLYDYFTQYESKTTRLSTEAN